MKRKVILLLIVFDIAFTAVVINSGERQATAALEAVAAIVALVGDYARPIPRLGGQR